MYNCAKRSLRPESQNQDVKFLFSSALLRIIITFYRKDLRVGTAFWSTGSLTLDFGGAQKNTSAKID